MKFEVISKEDKKLVLHVKDATHSQVNALRRVIQADLPSFAIDEVTFFENNSAMFNEYVAHRLALVPLTFDEEVSKETVVTLTLEATGPTSIYSKDLKSSDEKIKVYSEHIPIMKLIEGTSVRLEATAVLGMGNQHAKFQNAHASYAEFPVIESANAKALQEAIPLLPKGSVDDKGKIVRPEKVDLGHVTEQVEVKGKPGEFVFTVESYNNLTATEVLSSAVKHLTASADETKKELK
ncbi:MAG: DNA-directed RNA polymerase subunit D [Candidatus Woesearchaeota archaeon]|nr:DNA-directed RNA polymerase subunit D [Candidatus Woesearchaeota archaeon]